MINNIDRSKKAQLVLCGLIFMLLPALTLALTFPLPQKGDDIVGQTQTIIIQNGQEVSDIDEKYEVGYFELQEANPGVDLNHLWPATKLIIPNRYILPNAPRKGIVINLSELRLYYYPQNQPVVMTYPVGIGKEGEDTPLMSTKIVEKIKDPAWHPTDSTRAEAAEKGIVIPKIVASGPDNPLGPFAMRLGNPNYLIHGNNDPTGVGFRISGGCIHMFNQDIEKLFNLVTIGTSVDIVAQPFKTGWSGHKFYLEAHVPVQLKGLQAATHTFSPAITVIRQAVDAEHNIEIDWDKALSVADAQRGIPTVIGVFNTSIVPKITLIQKSNHKIGSIHDKTARQHIRTKIVRKKSK